METPIKELLTTASNHRLTATVADLADELNRRMDEAENLGRSKPEIGKLREKGRAAIAKATVKLADEEIERIRAELDNRRRDYADELDRNLTRRSIELEEARTRFGAMGEGELRAELERITTADFITEAPNVVDELFRTAKGSGVDPGEWGAYRKLVLDKNYRQPWLQNPEARGLNTELSAYEKIEPFTVPLVMRENGRVKTSSLAVDDLLDGGER